EPAGQRAAVAGEGVTVVSLLARVEHAVAARRRGLVCADVAGRHLRPGYAALVSRRASDILSGIDRGTPGKQGAGEGRPAVVPQDAELWVGGALVAGTGEATRAVAVEVVALGGDLGVAAVAPGGVVRDDRVLECEGRDQGEAVAKAAARPEPEAGIGAVVAHRAVDDGRVAEDLPPPQPPRSTKGGEG